MNVHPDCFGQGIARMLLSDITCRADKAGLPTRLVSSAMNLDSYSLYNRAGFVPRAAFQDMLITVPQGGMSELGAIPENAGIVVAAAQPSDIDMAARLEQKLVGIERRKDLQFFQENALGIWHLSVARDATGQIAGYMASIRHAASNMVGPGVATSPAAAVSLIYHELQNHSGNTAVVLVPVDQPEISGALYDWGARNCEMHFSQVRGSWSPPTGIVIPSFMPESG